MENTEKNDKKKIIKILEHSLAGDEKIVNRYFKHIRLCSNIKVIDLGFPSIDKCDVCNENATSFVVFKRNISVINTCSVHCLLCDSPNKKYINRVNLIYINSFKSLLEGYKKLKTNIQKLKFEINQEEIANENKWKMYQNAS